MSTALLYNRSLRECKHSWININKHPIYIYIYIHSIVSWSKCWSISSVVDGVALLRCRPSPSRSCEWCPRSPAASTPTHGAVASTALPTAWPRVWLSKRTTDRSQRPSKRASLSPGRTTRQTCRENAFRVRPSSPPRSDCEIIQWHLNRIAFCVLNRVHNIWKRVRNTCVYASYTSCVYARVCIYQFIYIQTIFTLRSREVAATLTSAWHRNPTREKTMVSAARRPGVFELASKHPGPFVVDAILACFVLSRLKTNRRDCTSDFHLA